VREEAGAMGIETERQRTWSECEAQLERSWK